MVVFLIITNIGITITFRTCLIYIFRKCEQTFYQIRPSELKTYQKTLWSHLYCLTRVLVDLWLKLNDIQGAYLIELIVEVKIMLFPIKVLYVHVHQSNHIPRIQLGTYQAALQCISHLQHCYTYPDCGARSTKHESHFSPANHIEIPLGSRIQEDWQNWFPPKNIYT